MLPTETRSHGERQLNCHLRIPPPGTVRGAQTSAPSLLSVPVHAVVGNVLIMLAIGSTSNLYTPMYFFIDTLYSVDICFTSFTVPKMLLNINPEPSHPLRGMPHSDVFPNFVFRAGQCPLGSDGL